MLELPLFDEEAEVIRASLRGDLDILSRAFFERRCRPEAFGEALVLAAMYRRTNAVQKLLELGVDPNYRGRFGRSAIENSSDNSSMVSLLLAHGATDHGAISNSVSAADGQLHLAARLGDREACRRALAQGAHIESKSRNGSGTALEVACGRCHLGVVIELLRHERSSPFPHREVTKRRAFRGALRGPFRFDGWNAQASMLSRVASHAKRALILALLIRYRAPPDDEPVKVKLPSGSRADLDDWLLHAVEEWRAEISAKNKK